MAETYKKKLNLKTLKSRNGGIISSQEALKDSRPFQWSDNVQNGRTKVVIKKAEDKNV